jgi:hypothetical protein
MAENCKIRFEFHVHTLSNELIDTSSLSVVTMFNSDHRAPEQYHGTAKGPLDNGWCNLAVMSVFKLRTSAALVIRG